MALIKSSEARQLIKEAIVLDLGDVAHQAAQIRAAAEDRARRILTEAQTQAQQLTANAHQQGHAQGLEQGHKEGLAKGLELGRKQASAQAAAEFKTLQQSWLDAINQWNTDRHTLEVGAREAVLEFALRLAEKVVHRVIQVDASVIADQLAAAVSHVLSPTDLVVHICPDDRAMLEQAMPQLAAELPQMKHVRLVDDAGVARGGCVVNYGQGRIDATLDTQLRRIVEVLLPDEDGAASSDAPADAPEAGEPA
jgi:flagellar assembly protein FliH